MTDWAMYWLLKAILYQVRGDQVGTEMFEGMATAAADDTGRVAEAPRITVPTPAPAPTKGSLSDAARSPTMTDLMVTPESLMAWLDEQDEPTGSITETTPPWPLQVRSAIETGPAGYVGRDGEPVTAEQKIAQLLEFGAAMDRLAVENNTRALAAEARVQELQARAALADEWAATLREAGWLHGASRNAQWLARYDALPATAKEHDDASKRIDTARETK